MMTRIRYQRKGNVLTSKSFVINSNLCVSVQINCNTFELKIKCDEKSESDFIETCQSLREAKYKARKKLIQLGMNFNREFRK
jgi:hypothetical protein